MSLATTALCALFAAGCPATPPAPAPSADPSAGVLESSEAPVLSTPVKPAVPIPMSGTWTHAGTGIAFPEAAAGFRRVMPKRYDVEGNDVGIGYSRMWRDFHAEVTVYVFPAPRRRDGALLPLDAEFAEECSEVREARKDCADVSAAEVAGALGGRAAPGRAAEFAFNGGPGFGGRRVASFLTTYDLGRWRLKYRVTLPAERRDVGLPAVAELLQAMDLPPLGDVPPAPAGK